MRPVALVTLALAFGCTPSGPALTPAPTVTVTVGGQLAPNMSLQLRDPAGVVVGSGSTGPDGKAVLRGPRDEPVPPGTYKVVAVDAGAAEENPMEVAKATTKNRVPASCGNPATTKLTLVVEAGKTDYALDIPAQ